MRNLCFFIVLMGIILLHGVHGEDPYRILTWKITYGDIYPLGVKQRVLSPSLLFSCLISRFFFFLSLSREYFDKMWEVEQGILINGQFPGPQIDSVTNDNLIISVYNYLTEPFLISWYESPFFSFLCMR